MTRPWLIVLIALGAAAAFATSGSLKHVSAGDAPDARTMRPGALGDFVRATVVHRLWLASLACDAVGVGLQALALHFGQLAVVQPILISALPITLVVRARFEHHQIRRVDVLWSLALTGALGGFLAVTLAGRPVHPEPVDRVPAYVAAGVGAALGVACIAIARRRHSPRPAAALVGVAVGTIYASTAALLKAISDVLARSPLQVLVSWQLYVAIVLGALGLLLGQLAFQAGPITASLAATSTVDPLASIVIGIVIFDERIGAGPGHGLLLAALLALLVVATIQLARPAAEDLPPAREPEETRRPAPTSATDPRES